MFFSRCVRTIVSTHGVLCNFVDTRDEKYTALVIYLARCSRNDRSRNARVARLRNLLENATVFFFYANSNERPEVRLRFSRSALGKLVERAGARTRLVRPRLRLTTSRRVWKLFEFLRAYTERVGFLKLYRFSRCTCDFAYITRTRAGNP